MHLSVCILSIVLVNCRVRCTEESYIKLNPEPEHYELNSNIENGKIYKKLDEGTDFYPERTDKMYEDVNTFRTQMILEDIADAKMVSDEISNVDKYMTENEVNSNKFTNEAASYEFPDFRLDLDSLVTHFTYFNNILNRIRALEETISNNHKNTSENPKNKHDDANEFFRQVKALTADDIDENQAIKVSLSNSNKNTTGNPEFKTNITVESDSYQATDLYEDLNSFATKIINLLNYVAKEKATDEILKDHKVLRKHTGSNEYTNESATATSEWTGFNEEPFFNSLAVEMRALEDIDEEDMEEKTRKTRGSRMDFQRSEASDFYFPPALTQSDGGKRFKQLVPAKGKVTIAGQFTDCKWNSNFFIPPTYRTIDQVQNGNLGIETANNYKNVQYPAFYKCAHLTNQNNVQDNTFLPPYFDNFLKSDVTSNNYLYFPRLSFRDYEYFPYESKPTNNMHLSDASYDNVHLQGVTEIDNVNSLDFTSRHISDGNFNMKVPVKGKITIAAKFDNCGFNVGGY